MSLYFLVSYSFFLIWEWVHLLQGLSWWLCGTRCYHTLWNETHDSYINHYCSSLIRIQWAWQLYFQKLYTLSENINGLSLKEYCRIVRNIVYALGSWLRATQILGISWIIEMSFVIQKDPLLIIPEFMRMRWLRVAPLYDFWMGPRKRKHLKGGIFCPFHW